MAGKWRLAYGRRHDFLEIPPLYHTVNSSTTVVELLPLATVDGSKQMK